MSTRRKDNVIHTVHSGANRVRLATTFDLERTIANTTGTGIPSCWVCTEKRMQERKLGVMAGEAIWVAVEEYGIVDQRADEEDLRGRCSHGKGWDGARIYEDVKTLTMPRGWSHQKKSLKRAGLVFFVESAATPQENKVLV